MFSGIECDVLPDGSLDYPDDVLARLDWVIASIHGTRLDRAAIPAGASRPSTTATSVHGPPIRPTAGQARGDGPRLGTALIKAAARAARR